MARCGVLSLALYRWGFRLQQCINKEGKERKPHNTHEQLFTHDLHFVLTFPRRHVFFAAAHYGVPESGSMPVLHRAPAASQWPAKKQSRSGNRFVIGLQQIRTWHHRWERICQHLLPSTFFSQAFDVRMTGRLTPCSTTVLCVVC